jgi:hypothetical protein
MEHISDLQKLFFVVCVGKTSLKHPYQLVSQLIECLQLNCSILSDFLCLYMCVWNNLKFDSMFLSCGNVTYAKGLLDSMRQHKTCTLM